MVKHIKLLLFALFMATSPLFSQTLVGISESTAKEILAVTEHQEQCWNRMDFEGYMSGYWNSDSLQFIGKNGITYGWKQTLKNYQKSYPDKSSSGKLTFTILYLEQLNSDAAFMVGKWQIEREKGDLTGHFSLLWKRINSQWVITSDQTD